MITLHEAIPSVIGFLILGIYHIWLFLRLERRPETTAIGLANRMRILWVAEMMKDGKHEILPVQTLRNLTMAASFLASTAIIIGLAVFNAALAADNSPVLSHLSNMIGISPPGLWALKLFLLSGIFLSCFYNFMLAIRYYNHTALLINVPLIHHSKYMQHRPGFLIRIAPMPGIEPGVSMVADLLNQGAAHYTLGMRGYYFVIPFALWLAGGMWFMISSIILVIILHRIDSPG
jgi:uncharacterized membrane protein